VLGARRSRLSRAGPSRQACRGGLANSATGAHLFAQGAQPAVEGAAQVQEAAALRSGGHSKRHGRGRLWNLRGTAEGACSMRSNDPLPWLGVQAPLDLPRASLDRSVSSPAPGHALSPDGLTMEELVAKYLTSRAYFPQRCRTLRFRACVSAARSARRFDPL